MRVWMECALTLVYSESLLTTCPLLTTVDFLTSSPGPAAVCTTETEGAPDEVETELLAAFPPVEVALATATACCRTRPAIQVEHHDDVNQ